MSKHLPRADAEASPARRIRVVVVEDSELFLRALGGLLLRFVSLEIVGEAENGLDGFALAARLRPDLVITDLHMPGIAGLQLVELLHYNYPAMRTIVTSVQDGPAVEAASLRHGADAFITKQRLPKELPHELRRLFPDGDEPGDLRCKR